MCCKFCLFSACQPYELPCRDGRGCYLEKKKCDFYPDCLDSSDEEFCRGMFCLPDSNPIL